MVNKWQREDLNPGSLDVEACAHNHYLIINFYVCIVHYEREQSDYPQPITAPLFTVKQTNHKEFAEIQRAELYTL